MPDRSSGATGQDVLPPRELAEEVVRLQGERLFRAVGLLFLLALLFRFFEPISRVLLIVFTTVILAVAYNAAVQRMPMRRGLAVLTLAALTLGATAASIWFIVSTLTAQVRQFIDEFPAIVEGVEAWIQGVLGLDIEVLGPRAQRFLSDALGSPDGAAVLSGALGFLELIALTVLVFIGSFFVVYRPNEQLLDPLIRAVPRHRRPAFRRMFKLMGERLSGWLWGTLICMAAVGILSVIAFYLLGTPYPALLAVIMFVTDVIPIVGPWIGGVVAVAVTLFDDPGRALWVAIAIIVIQEIESNLIRPIAMSSSARLHPFVTIIALLLFGSLFGLLGAILALPLALAAATLVQVLWVEHTLDAGDDEIAPVVDT